MTDLINAAFHGVTVAIVILHFVDVHHQTKINKMQNRKIDKLQRTINELEEVKQWKNS